MARVSLLPARAAAPQQAVLTIVTDGKPTDGDLAHAMQPLSALPVWVVVRLCTDEQDVVDYWGNLDNVVEIEVRAGTHHPLRPGCGCRERRAERCH